MRILFLSLLVGMVIHGPARPSDGPSRGSVLVAGRNLADPNFSRTVVLILGYGRDGAFGVVINRPTNIVLSELMEGLESSPLADENLFIGGPVQPHNLWLLVSSASAPTPSRHIFGNVYLCTSVSILERMISRGGMEGVRVRVFAGYAGWAPGQLEHEIARGDWILLPAEEDDIFTASPDRLWDDLLEDSTAVWTKLLSAPRRK